MSSIASFSSLMAAAMLLTPTGPPLNLSMMRPQGACGPPRRSRDRPPRGASCAARATSPVMLSVGADLRVVAHAPQQAVRDARRAA